MHLKVALANVWINGDLSGLPLLTEGVTCSFFLYFDITPSVDPVIFEITTCEEFWLCNREAISRAKMGVGLPIVLPLLTRILGQTNAKQEDKLRESLFYVTKWLTHSTKVNKFLLNAKHA